MVLGQIEFGQVLALLEASQVLDLFAGGLEYVDVFQHFVGEIALRQVQGIAHGCFEVLVGNRRRRDAGNSKQQSE